MTVNRPDAAGVLSVLGKLAECKQGQGDFQFGNRLREILHTKFSAQSKAEAELAVAQLNNILKSLHLDPSEFASFFASMQVPTRTGVIRISDVEGLSEALAALVIDTITIADVDGLLAALNLKENKSEKGQINGYASLNASAQVPNSEISAASVRQHVASMTGVGSPVGVATPVFVGCSYRDTSTGLLYMSTGTLNTNWQVI